MGWQKEIDKYLKDVINSVSLQSVSLWLLITLVVFLLAFIFFRNSKINAISCVSLPVLAFYLSFVATITVVSKRTTSSPQYRIMLFWSYKAISDGDSGLLSQVLWNVVLFIPIGILLMLVLTCKRNWMVAVTIGFLLSSTIEIAQLISHRGLFEFDDIVHNTLGTTIGVVLIIIASSMLKMLKSKRAV